MKKVIFGTALASMALLSACSSDNELANVETAANNAIGFHVVGNKAETRATIIDNKNILKGSEKELIDLSPALHVSQDTPPTFIWHTANDSLVYSINSIMFGKALYEQDIPFELHIFEDGPHGLSLCDETSAGKEEHINHRCKKWFEMAIDFLNNQFNKKQ